MTAVATVWRRNSTKGTDAVLYSDPTILYSSPLQAYSSSSAALNDDGQTAAVWRSSSKQASIWHKNRATEANLYTYDDPTITYDALNRTFDGVMAGDTIGQAVPTVWRKA